MDNQDPPRTNKRSPSIYALLAAALAAATPGTLSSSGYAHLHLPPSQRGDPPKSPATRKRRRRNKRARQARCRNRK